MFPPAGLRYKASSLGYRPTSVMRMRRRGSKSCSESGKWTRSWVQTKHDDAKQMSHIGSRIGSSCKTLSWVVAVLLQK
jgi:hypothetical protein